MKRIAWWYSMRCHVRCYGVEKQMNMNKEIYKLCKWYVEECDYIQTKAYKRSSPKIGYRGIILNHLKKELENVS
tara:strand:- start:1630 stop:1851 length:222 start_codon:yes stop_codon:yes gene_type:complete